MDPQRFDTLIKTLSTSGTRRGALGGLLAGTLSALGLADVPAKQRRHATAEGPCGNGSGKANACEKDKDCCTGYCHKKKGRCRCKQLGQSCTEDRNCCASAGQPMTCQSGSCQTVPVPPGCTPTTCAAQGNPCGTIPNGCGGTISCGGNGACCGTPNGGTRCQGGACVAATATFADCQGRCNDPGGTFAVTICGQPATCPACTACGCGGGCTGTGPNGFGQYCTSGGPLGQCPGGTCPGGQVCCGNNCQVLCTI